MKGYVSKRCVSEMQLSSNGVPQLLNFCSTLMLCGNQQWHLKRCKLADRLSELQDDILISILSRLKLKEATRTSVLSRRWRNLWTYTTGALDFHYSDPFPDGLEGFSLLFDYFLDRNVERTGKLPLVGRPELIAWVNRVLTLHQGSTIDELNVSLNLRGRIRKEVIDEWVAFALSKRAKKIKLDFTGYIPTQKGNYYITKHLLCKFNFNLESLTVLYLNKVDVSSKVIHFVLLKCCFLEELHLERSFSLKELKVRGPLPHLKYLKIINCFKLKYMKINAINIVSFAYHGYDIPVTFKKAPVLVEASLGGCYASYFVKNISHFSSYISGVKSLVLDLSSSSKYLSDEMLPELPFFANMKELELILQRFGVEGTLNCCASLLKKCPILTRLSLKVCLKMVDHPKDWRTIIRSSKFLHSYLKVLELVGFNGSEETTEIDCLIVSCLPSLEQVLLRPSFCKYLDRVVIKEKFVAFCKQLDMIKPPGAELVIVS